MALTQPFPKLVVGMVLLTTIASLMEGATLSLAIPLLQKLAGGGVQTSSMEASSFIQSLLSFFDRFPPEQQLGVIIACLLTLSIAKGGLRFIADFSLRTLMLKVGLHLRSICIDRFLNLGLSYYNQARAGDLLSYVNEQSQRCEMLTFYIGSIFSESLIVFSFVVLLFSISWQLTLLSLVMLLGIGISLKFIVASVKASGRIVSETIEEFSSRVFEVISGIRIIKSYTAESYEGKRLSDILQQRYSAELRGYAGQAAVQPISDTCGIFILVILVILGNRFLSQDLVLPLLLTFLLVMVRMFPRINQLNGLRVSLANFYHSFQTIQYFLEQTKTPDICNGSRQFTGLQEKICFESVTFSHQNSENPILKQVNMVIPKGSFTALVGESGSGKSTLADLLLRFYDPQMGKITIDGVDIRDLDIKSLRQRMAIVSQDTFLFNDTVRENIKYGNPQATDAEIVEAARQAYAEEFIQALPQGFDTILGDRGVQLSGGQRQRLAISRAIVRNPEILILDEATSALDSSSERIVQQALNAVGKNRTVLVIAHRLSTIHQADQIIVLKQGQILEQGSHSDLMAREGYYYRLNLDQKVDVLS
ncbi:ABC transporter ATP-binding protein [Anabaena sphaerica FACHB-251]|uniref:ABC transporter ATP-binding protein n=1 Tax=Anabaena sphaerica FACHB-251 TaxID=2692883 RepID=A0A926WD92_9NOST|nr:ABC transporter ATP-binding protein [Anabaena sphaerica]MBD2292374.1 ABC transporter ATP-binding protein [Anabaena sphaerica FACHB-251]